MDQKELIELQAKYKLTEEEYKQYYHAVNMFFTAGKQSEEKPKLVFVAGQAGAGKSRLIPVVNKKLNYNAVVIDYDVIRSMHPKFESYTSTFFRYAMQLESDANPRWVPKSVHDSSYDNFIVTLQRFESEGLFEYATVYKRGERDPEPFYSIPQVPNEIQIGMPMPNFIGFKSPSEAVIYGRKKFKDEALKKFSSEYQIIYNIFSEYEPKLMPYVEELQAMYVEESAGQDKKEIEGEDRDD